MGESLDRPSTSWEWEPEKKLVRSLSPRLGALLDYVAEFRSRSQARACEMLEVAADQIGGEEQLLLSLTDNEPRLRLLEQAVIAAEASRLDAKVRAIGLALASGALASDESTIDEHGLIIKVIADLEMPHIRVLRELSTRSYTIVQLGERLQTSTMLALAIVAALRRHGLAFDGIINVDQMKIGETPVLDFENRREIELSAFGHRLLAYLVASSAS